MCPWSCVPVGHGCCCPAHGLDPSEPVGHVADVLSLEKPGPDLSARRIFRIRMSVLKVHGSNNAYRALLFLNGYR